jgi:FkbM family methyltransferase
VAAGDDGRVVVDGGAADAGAGVAFGIMTLSEVGNAIGDRLGRHGVAVQALRPLYGMWLQAAYGRRGVPWHVNGEPLRIDPRVRHLIPHHNERPLFDYLKQHMRRGEVALDIGSFLGTYAIFAARWVGAQGRVLAFEPSPSSFDTLCRHLSMNDLAAPSQVTPRCAAVGAREERRELVTYDDEPYRNEVAPVNGDVDDRRRAVVEVVTVDAVCRSLGRPPDWIRMDVQGLEFDVLRGARDVLHEGRGHLRIVVEMHPEQWPDHGIEPAGAVDLLAALGLRARPLVPGEPAFQQSGHAILEAIR